ncbi:MAG: hypothetical protein AB8G23_04865 [Myxococcota bacterium]
MSRIQPRIAARTLVLGAAFLVLFSSSASAQLDHTSIYRGFGRYLCGPDWDETSYQCDERSESISENDLVDLAAEFARLTFLSAAEDEIEEADLIERGFFRLCEENPARCLGWIADFSRTGSIDSDIDGVLDSADACPGTSTAIGEAQSILLAQEVALLEVEQSLRAVFELLIQAANGTLGSSIRASIGESMIPIFEELLLVANKKAEGRYVLGGANSRRAPFTRSGSFEDPEGPVVVYQGSEEPLVLPIGPSGEALPVTVDARALILGDLDQDGRYPDSPGVDLFEFIKRARNDLLTNDEYAVRERLTELIEANAAQLSSVSAENQRRFATTKRSYPSRELSQVDAAGCSQAQFCSSISVVGKKGRSLCIASDYLNDEPLRRAPRDCRVKKLKRGPAQCVEARTQWRSPNSLDRKPVKAGK